MIEILHYEPVNKNKLIGYVDIRVTIHGVGQIYRKINHLADGEKKWFNVPSFKRDVNDPQGTYEAFYEFDKKIHTNQLLEALHEPVKQYCLKNKIAEIKPLDLSGPIQDFGTLPF